MPLDSSYLEEPTNEENRAIPSILLKLNRELNQKGISGKIKAFSFARPNGTKCTHFVGGKPVYESPNLAGEAPGNQEKRAFSEAYPELNKILKKGIKNSAKILELQLHQSSDNKYVLFKES
jgi:hypothetical protein